jgi:beta-glucosidase/6-phospho-beta-glucosidase/beta-galactosidase
MQEQAANCTLNVLKSHAASVKEFRKLVPGGMISMNLNAEWALPKDPNSEADKVNQILFSTRGLHPSKD